jgi:hypothetical protein
MSFTDNYIFALGTKGEGTVPGKSRFWYSVDGDTWVLVDLSLAPYNETQPIVSVALTSSIAVAVAGTGNVYMSADLSSWTKTPMTAYLNEVTKTWSGTVATGWLLFVTGRKYNGEGDLVPAYAVSADHGATWTSCFWPSHATLNYDVINRIKSLIDDNVYALGYNNQSDAGILTPLIYRSTDGINWVQMVSPPMV